MLPAASPPPAQERRRPVLTPDTCAVLLPAAAAGAANAAKKGTHTKGVRKARFTTSFHRPKTQALLRKPMYDRKATVTSKKFDAYQVTFSHRLLVMYTPMDSGA